MFLAGALAAVMLVTVFAAGCTSPIAPSPTPSPSTAASTSATTTTATAQNVSQYLGAMMQQRNFTVEQPFAPQPRAQAGAAVYTGTVRDQNGTYVVSVHAWNSRQLARTQFVALRGMYMGQRYAQLQANATAWSGFNATAQRGASVEYGTSLLMPHYVMVITGGATGGRPYQQAMWRHMQDEMGEHMGAYGPGPYMGYGLTSQVRARMQDEMEEHMGGAYGPGYGPRMMGRGMM